MSVTDNIKKILEQLRLNAKEIKIYLTLLQSGPQTVQNIARATSISRSTVYQRVENLKQIGIVELLNRGEGKKIRALDPKTLEDLIQKKLTKTKKLREEFQTILPELSNLYQPESTKTKVLYFEGVKGIKRQIMKYDMESNSKDVYGYATLEMIDVLGNEWIDEVYHKKFWEKGYRDHYIMSNSDNSKDFFSRIKKSKLFKNERIFIRTLPEKHFNPEVSVALYDDKYSIQLMKSGKPFGVIIQNQEIADHQMEIFNLLWTFAKKI